MSPIRIKESPSMQPPARLREQFELLAAEWQRATAHLSSMTAASRHPAYQSIIALGPSVVPLLLHDMAENETHWFIALRDITGADPIPQAAAGSIPQMVAAWLQWAKDQGISW